jgi:hypothetical protein
MPDLIPQSAVPQRPEGARPLKPARVVHQNKRGGQIWAINGDTITIRVHAEQHSLRDYDVPRSLIPHTVIVGDACVVTVAGAWPYTITAVSGARFAGPAPVNQAASVAAGTFSPGHIEYTKADGGPYWED